MFLDVDLASSGAAESLGAEAWVVRGRFGAPGLGAGDGLTSANDVNDVAVAVRRETASFVVGMPPAP